MRYGKANRSENDTSTAKRVCYAQSPRGGRNATPYGGRTGEAPGSVRRQRVREQP